MLHQYFRVDGAREYNLFFLTETFFFAFDPYNAYNVDDVWQGGRQYLRLEGRNG